MGTRERIINTAVEAFNQRGFHDPTIADIALRCGMSRGNLVYHFKDKNALLDEISTRLVSDIKEIQSARKAYPAFSNLSLDMKTYSILQERYPFIFRDTSVLEHQAISEVMTGWSEKSIQRNKEAFAFAIEVGNMKREPFDGLYHHLAVNAWLITYYWVSQKVVRRIENEEDAERMVWSTILPHFTPKGIKAFTSYYGTEYLSQLGIPISTLIDNRQFF